MSFDAAGNLFSRSDPNGNTLSYARDAAGRATAMVDAEGRMTSFAYDDLNRLSSRTSPAGATVGFAYGDGAPGCTSCVSAGGSATQPSVVVDPLGSEWRMSYDGRDRVVSRTDPPGQTERYQYDSANRQRTTYRANGETVIETYDAEGRLTRKDGSDGTFAAFSYDVFGNLARAETADTTTELTWNASGWLLESRTTKSGGAQPLTDVKYGYDKDGLIDTIELVGVGAMGYGRNSRGEVTSIQRPDGKTIYLTRNAVGRVTKITHPNGTRTDYAYDAAGRVTSIVHTGPSGTISRFDYGYDKSGRVTQVGELDGSHIYSHDADGRTTVVDHPSASPLPDESYSYDLFGNRLSSHLSATYAYDVASRLESDDSYDYTFDGANRMTERIEGSTSQTTHYTWEAFGRLTGATGPGVAQSYRYDALDRLVSIDGAEGVRVVYRGISDVPLASFDADGQLASLLITDDSG
ncbi:MAG: RHS repeat protein [Candidatus Schekmanbacteria bacterium]|nr:RHS repeat protein [Candidatus Schekmanbacteria bacterium]